MDMNNTCSIHEIVEDTLREAWNKEWNFNEFIVMGTWKPKKKNLCNNRFMRHCKTSIIYFTYKSLGLFLNSRLSSCMLLPPIHKSIIDVL